MTLPYGSMLCDGVASHVTPTRPMVLCMDCDRRLTKPTHVLQKYLQPAPAKHDGKAWNCDKRVQAA